MRFLEGSLIIRVLLGLPPMTGLNAYLLRRLGKPVLVDGEIKVLEIAQQLHLARPAPDQRHDGRTLDFSIS